MKNDSFMLNYSQSTSFAPLHPDQWHKDFVKHMIALTACEIEFTTIEARGTFLLCARLVVSEDPISAPFWGLGSRIRLESTRYIDDWDHDMTQLFAVLTHMSWMRGIVAMIWNKRHSGNRLKILTVEELVPIYDDSLYTASDEYKEK